MGYPHYTGRQSFDFRIAHYVNSTITRPCQKIGKVKDKKFEFMMVSSYLRLIKREKKKKYKGFELRTEDRFQQYSQGSKNEDIF